VGYPSHAIDVAVRDEQALEARLGDVAEGVVHDPIAERAALILRRSES